jgi:hypothetical protein
VLVEEHPFHGEGPERPGDVKALDEVAPPQPQQCQPVPILDAFCGGDRWKSSASCNIVRRHSRRVRLVDDVVDERVIDLERVYG